ncbi:bestrophin-2 isoform X2 [Aethina tumida]|uniref:bestrophin-2 isoform X2 n=1 Tax=Aethina tumida TaxID=116153 RepID=UPI002147D634|nr:bestrophin-2 isoform X2 [Aethina tumida]
MTVTYTSEVTSGRGISAFLKLLLRWKGSIYKIVWIDLLIFISLYYIIFISYTYSTNEHYTNYLVKIINYCRKYRDMIPLSFVLGFYVSLVMTRWWDQYRTIPFPDNLAILVGAIVKGQDERARIVRRTIVRYACVAFTITLTMMSPKVKKRFPTTGHLVETGLITKEEKKIMEDLDLEYPSYSKYWLPLAWGSNITTRARHEGLITDDEAMQSIIDELNSFRSKLGGMLDYDWISVPLVYTQVVTLAVYTYFLISLFSNQSINGDESTDICFPLIPILEFFFYMGWLKVAESLINPFGEDDDDFEVNWMVDRHIQVCYLLVDKIHHEHPKLMKDTYWARAPKVLPYTIAAQNYMSECPIESTKNIKVKKNEQDLLIPDLDETDGKTRGSTSVWNILKNPSGKRIHGIPLNSISKPETEVLDENIEINEYETTGPDRIKYQSQMTMKDLNPEVTEFEMLRKARLEEHRQKIMDYLKLIKSDNLEDKSDSHKKID